jgi:hypothetical protein
MTPLGSVSCEERGSNSADRLNRHPGGGGHIFGHLQVKLEKIKFLLE